MNAFKKHSTYITFLKNKKDKSFEEKLYLDLCKNGKRYIEYYIMATYLSDGWITEGSHLPDYIESMDLRISREDLEKIYDVKYFYKTGIKKIKIYSAYEYFLSLKNDSVIDRNRLLYGKII